VCAAGETVHLWQRGLVRNEPCGCGLPFASCGFWRQVGQQGFGGWGEVDPFRVASLAGAVDRSRSIPRLVAGGPGAPGRRPALGEYVSYYQRLYAGLAAASGSGVLIDSSKHPSLAFCLRWLGPLRLRVVHVVRDSRAVAYSWTRLVRRPEAAPVLVGPAGLADPAGAAPESGYVTRYSPAVSAGLWNGHNAALALLARCGVPVLRVRYEDLAADPAAVLARIAGFAGLPGGPFAGPAIGGGPGHWWAELGPSHTVSGNTMRFTTGQVPIRPDDRWRAALPAADRRLVTALTLPMLAGYGYLRRTA
jgi:hypothetical protein